MNLASTGSRLHSLPTAHQEGEAVFSTTTSTTTGSEQLEAHMHAEDQSRTLPPAACKGQWIVQVHNGLQVLRVHSVKLLGKTTTKGPSS